MAKHKRKQQGEPFLRPLRPSESKVNTTRIGDGNLDERISVVGLQVEYGHNSAKLAQDRSYIAQDEPTNLQSVITVPLAMTNKLRAVSNRYSSGISPTSRSRETQRTIAHTWPQTWNYLSKEQVEELKTEGLIDSKHLLMEILGTLEYGRFLYQSTNIQGFFNSLIELAWIDYAVRQQIDFYRSIYDPKHVTIGVDFEFNSLIAKCWIILENCVIRIAGIWNRIRSYLLPMYFFGASVNDVQPKLSNDNPWKDLDTRIRKIVSKSKTQETFYTLLAKASIDFEQSTFKNLRNRVVHEFVQRPEGSVPTGTQDIPSLKTIEDLYEAVLEELGKVREAIVVFAAMLMNKNPQNEAQGL